MIALPLAAKAAGGFVMQHWKTAVVALLLGVTWLHGCSSGVRSERPKTLAAQLETQKVRTEHEQLVAEAERRRAAAEAENRRIEQGWRQWVSQREKDHVIEKDALVAERDAARAGKRVLDAAVDAYARAGFTTGDPAAACRDLRARVETLGDLVKERDGMAGVCEEQIELVGSSLRLCRGYVEGIGGRP